jgi:hypothetical protein
VEVPILMGRPLGVPINPYTPGVQPGEILGKSARRFPDR